MSGEQKNEKAESNQSDNNKNKKVDNWWEHKWNQVCPYRNREGEAGNRRSFGYGLLTGAGGTYGLLNLLKHIKASL